MQMPQEVSLKSKILQEERKCLLVMLEAEILGLILEGRSSRRQPDLKQVIFSSFQVKAHNRKSRQQKE